VDFGKTLCQSKSSLNFNRCDFTHVSLKKFRLAGFTQWTITHAFYADMGGILLQVPGYPEFPIDAEQLYYLVDNKYINFPEIHEEDIEDRNKPDGLAR
jgi:hypothetical protein